LTQREAQIAASTMEGGGWLKLQHGDPEIRVAGKLRDVVLGTQPRLLLAALEKVPHPSLTHQGGEEIPNDPRDPEGLKTEQRQFELQIKLANPSDFYVSGQRAWIRLTVDRKPLIWQWFRKFLQLIETRESQGSKLV